MATNALIHITAEVLPDDIRSIITGKITHAINDVGNNNYWIRNMQSITTAAENIIGDGVQYIKLPAVANGYGIETSDASADDLGLLIIKHSGYRDTEGGTVSTDNLYINTAHGVAASGGAGDMILKPGELWWGRFVHSDFDDISLEASANTIRVQIYAIADDGGV